MKIIFFGTPPFAAKILEYITGQGQEIVAVVTRPDRPRGRSQKMLPSAVKALVQEKFPHIPIFQPEKASTQEFAEELKKFEADLFVVVAYGEILKQNILDIPKKTCLNVHASILPKYRGAAPIQRVIMNGEKESGITIMEMVLKMDAGDIYHVATTPIPLEMTFGELEEKLCGLSCGSLLDVLKKIESGQAVKVAQNEKEVTFAPKISLEDRQIDWERGALEIHNQIRGLSPFPGAFCFVEVGGEKKRLLIKKSIPVNDMEGELGATLKYEKNAWIVGCGQEALSLLEIQLEGKKNLEAGDFIRGIPTPPKFMID